ncbi:hypothetical protein KC19_VG083400 [Ceratodon purpureus]|uniref:Uncharacterized protein n=1 Tax=Ceratodon purpureus TaxID=3225 RepID=A0A8T0HNA9_CERPU|nr:hypothetical protein KC19_VG083400 [Ceratodon purpureus]
MTSTRHELGLVADKGVRMVVEQSEVEVPGNLDTVANPELRPGWLCEIERHFTLCLLQLELNLEKLQLLATSKASPVFSIKWIECFKGNTRGKDAAPQNNQ